MAIYTQNRFNERFRSPARMLQWTNEIALDAH